MNRPQFVNDEIYHIYNRGVDKRNVFLDKQDHFRFIHDLFEFNNEVNVNNKNYYFNSQNIEVEPRYFEENKQKKQAPRILLVELLAFCLMPNHYHLLVRQKKDDGIVKFMQKIGTGYTMYFNQKNERVGSLFQGRFRAINVSKQEYLDHLFFYIHFNSLDLFDSNWQKLGAEKTKDLIAFLENYRWSSHLDYLGKKNFPSLTQREFMLKTLGGYLSYKEQLEKSILEINQNNGREDFRIIKLE